jgi:hypothetical protein
VMLALPHPRKNITGCSCRRSHAADPASGPAIADVEKATGSRPTPGADRLP